MNITATLETIYPAQAQFWLDHHNVGNRRMRDWWSIALSAAITRGEWISSHQGIAFTESGKLGDGQHRLKAIVLAGVPVQMFVFRGVPDDAFKVIDVGIKRRTEDVTGLDKKTAEVASFLARIAFGSSTAHQIITIAETGVGEIHERLLARCATTKAIYSSAPVRAAAVVLAMDGFAEDGLFDTYANLIHQRFDQLPPIAHSLIRQVGEGRVRATRQLDMLARALKTLNPKHGNLTKLQIGEEDGTNASNYARKVIGRVLPPPSAPKQSTFLEMLKDMEPARTRKAQSRLSAHA